MEKENSYTKLWHLLQEYLKMNIEYARLTAAEKLTLFFTAVAVASGVFVLAIIFFFFLSLALVNWIAMGIGLVWSYIIMSAVYLLLIALLIVFRRQLIMNPVAKLVSRLLLK